MFQNYTGANTISHAQYNQKIEENLVLRGRSRGQDSVFNEKNELHSGQRCSTQSTKMTLTVALVTNDLQV
jgi:hypothetical protein